jgi:hypothetical protein
MFPATIRNSSPASSAATGAASGAPGALAASEAGTAEVRFGR